VNRSLQIHPKFEQIIPPLTADEFAQLEENILKLGKVTDPIKVWNDMIVDGHHRYKIVQKYPDIPYTTCDLEFQDEYEAIAWMCSTQLGRRNITDAHRQYLLGKRYDAERSMHGGDRRSEKQKSTGQIGPLKSDHATRAKIAQETKTNESFVKHCYRFARGVDIAEEELPGIRQRILSGEISPIKSEIYALTNMPKEKRKVAVEQLILPKNERQAHEIARQIEEDFQNDVAQEETDAPLSTQKASIATMNEAKEQMESAPQTKGAPTREIEESIIHSMYGTLNMFIESINDYLTRFPRLISEPKYRDQVRELMVATQNYIQDVEGELR